MCIIDIEHARYIMLYYIFIRHVVVHLINVIGFLVVCH